MSEATYAIGIDLGTTNSALSFVPLAAEDKSAPAVFDLPQITAAGEVGDRPLLPSFVYMPSDVELPEGSIALPWDKKRSYAVGAFARERSSSVPMRVVASAKSWLSHQGVDRRAAILPFGAPDEGAEGGVPKISPVEASARILGHLRDAWNQSHKNDKFADQDVVITVPASFDAVARQLTEEAARQIGVQRLTLLEEPQAALYSWVAAQGDGWRKQVAVGDLLFVCDIGGGTTDFSLIEVFEEGGNLQLRRVAVGDHILLGGDNMDLALAHRVKVKLEEEGKTLDDWQLRSLAHSCRQAKETLLENEKKEQVAVVVPGRGSKLVGGTIKSVLTREELDQTLLDGFFPQVKSDARPTAQKRTGLQTLGLPYATDAGITRHMAAFLGRDAPAGKALRAPTALLFNGGVTKSVLLRERIAAILNKWLKADGAPEAKILEGGDPDLAVAKGAAYYGRVRIGRGVRIKGGAARSYYVGIERAELAVPGIPPRVDAVCVAPFGMEEGTEVELPTELGLVVGEPAAFRFFQSSARKEDKVATTIDPKKGELEELPPIETSLPGDATHAAGNVVPVKLHARVTEVGTLELSAVEPQTSKRWKLEFNIRVE